MIGIILFSAGNLFSIFANFSWTSIFSMLILALPVTGFWLIFAASKAPKLPEMSLNALKLFKVYAIIALVQSCFSGLLFLIGAIILFVSSSALSSLGVSGGIAAFAGIILLIAAGAVVAVAVLYFKAILKILANLLNGVTQNVFVPLPDIKMFTLLTYISVGLSAVGALASMIISIVVGSYISAVTSMLPDFIGSMVQNIFGTGLPLDEFFTLAGLAGIVICVLVLNKFNNHYFGNSSAPR